MKYKTLDWIEWLLARGWTIRCKTRPNPERPDLIVEEWQWFDASRSTGKAYQSDRFDRLPVAVVAYISREAIMVAS